MGRGARRSGSCARGWAIAAALACVVPSSARAGGGSFTQGDQAAMTGGAVVATVSDPGAAWYNPAGLALNDRRRFNLSGSLYGIRRQRVDDGLSVQVDGVTVAGASLEGTELVIVAPTVVIASALGRGTTLALGVFVTDTGYQWLDGVLATTVDGGDLGPVAIDTSYDGNFGVVRYHLGPVVGWAVSRRLRLGVQLMGIYESRARRSYGAASGTASVPAGTAEFSVVDQNKDSPIHWALELGLGLQWEILPRLHFGLMVRGPGFMARETPQQRVVTTSSVVLPGDVPNPGDPPSSSIDTVIGPPMSAASPGLIRPLEVTSGFGWYYDHGWIDVEFEYRMGLTNREARVELEPVWNVRAGIHHRLANVVSVGAGVFTDRSDEVRGVLSGPVHLYGLALGLQTRMPVRLYRGGATGEDAEAAEGPERLYFGTTLGVRYAAGVGDVQSVAVTFGDACDGSSGEICFVAGNRTQRVQHEVSIYLGTSLEF